MLKQCVFFATMAVVFCETIKPPDTLNVNVNVTSAKISTITTDKTPSSPVLGGGNKNLLLVNFDTMTETEAVKFLMDVWLLPHMLSRDYKFGVPGVWGDLSQCMVNETMIGGYCMPDGDILEIYEENPDSD